MSTPQNERPQESHTKRNSELRDERLRQLVDSCQQEVLRQIIGPFGLTPAMFDDKDGGNVTTTHNFEKGITATDYDFARYEAYQNNLNKPIDRKAYDVDLRSKRKKLFQSEEPLISAYTGKELPRDGRTELDHVRSAKSMETNARANLFMNKDERVAVANAPENIVPTEGAINQSMQDKDKVEWSKSLRKNDPGKTNSESFGVNQKKLEETKRRADKHITKELFKSQTKKQGTEILTNGGLEASKNAMRQALGVLLHEFVNGSFNEIKTLLRERDSKENLIDRLVMSLKRVMDRVIRKLKAALDAAIQGGIQGFISNLLTFLINNLITTSKKIVAIIRESMQSLWRAIKLMINPPENMSTLEVTREMTKIIAAVVTTGLGMLMEESVKGFILSIPVLAPIADALATGLTAIMTGIAGALLIYSIDQLFDWLRSSGTQILEAYEKNLEAQAEVIGRMQNLLSLQYDNSRLYKVCEIEYQQIQQAFSKTDFYLEAASISAEISIQSRITMIETFETHLDRKKRLEVALKLLLKK